ncbi:MAG: permease-like cell division protein FtsX [Erysipelotrichaceae bacterium]|nr:permease-like cell division protein FtsX [Erysipelotrichaceae bacterium]
MINNFFRHLKEGFFGVGRHGAMSVSSASAVTITLIIVSIFYIFSMNLQKFTKGIEQSVQIAVMISFSHEEQAVMDQIGVDISNIEGVSNVAFHSKEEELQSYIDSLEDDYLKQIIEPYKEDNPMHNAFYVSVSSGEYLQSVANKIKEIEGVDSINYGGDSAVVVVNALKSIRNGGGVLAIALSLLAIFLIQNTIKLTIQARSDEIAIMRNVGARNGFIRTPFLVEGVIIGILGSIIPIMITIYGYIYIYNVTGGMLITNLFKLIPPHPFVLKVSLLLLATGVFVGLIGSFFSVNKYLRWKR